MTMASSLGIGCGGNNGVVMDHLGKLSIENRCNLPRFVVVGDQSRSRARKRRISMAATATVTPATLGLRNMTSLDPFEKYEEGEKEECGKDVAYERLDEWMRESVVEIVKNLREAPLLVQIYPKKKDNISSETATLMTEKAAADDWPALKEKWEKRETPLPEGVIFVEELGGDETGRDGGETTTRVWGVVVQGKGIGCGPVCYLLKTSRVRSGPGPGMGLCCTHFCLTRVKSFRETVNSQLKNCWLLQSQ
ncbi:hypothetical protein L6164_030193 [Bauhinia variegata]|uniref:Uncharacterized protein n=1 Tax=Bauhinia variegata TaxID=167791 RepID=A0ACB9LCW4_BAUVA|nr:hypothetical protein L6164_030193 [Bauhinia variegata]